MQEGQRGKRADDPSGLQGLARFSAIITILPASMAAGWVIGYYLVDRFLETFPWGSIILTLFAAGAGFYEIVKILAPDRNQDDRFDG